MSDDLGQIRKVTPSDSGTIDPFKYIQVGVSGTVTVKASNGTETTITSALLDKVAIVPVGVSVQVLATGTTATDIYVWG
jgi:hypothetical protein